MVCVFNVNELLLGFIDGGVTTGGLFHATGLGMETFGVMETEVSGLKSFFFLLVGCGVNANEVGGVLP